MPARRTPHTREAVCAGIVCPAELAQKAGSQKQPRFSLADVEAAKDWWEPRSAEHEQAAADDDSEILADPAEAEPRPATAADVEVAAMASSPSAAAPIVSEPHDRFAALQPYLRGAISASELPDWFWLEPLCPEFLPQAGLFRYVFGGTTVLEDPRQDESGTVTAIRRSAGYVFTEGGDLVGAPEDGTFEFEPGLHNPGDVPSRYAADTLRWQQRRAEWEPAWERRAEF